jgi:hypothetical protein
MQQLGQLTRLACGRRWETIMLSDDYSRLHAACLVMARQYDLPGVQARWLVMAEASLDLANVVDKKRRHSRKVIQKAA